MYNLYHNHNIKNSELRIFEIQITNMVTYRQKIDKKPNKEKQ